MGREYTDGSHNIEAVAWLGINFLTLVEFGGAAIEPGEEDKDTLVLHTTRGKWLIRIGDYVVKDGEELKVMDTESFEKIYKAK